MLALSGSLATKFLSISLKKKKNPIINIYKKKFLLVSSNTTKYY